MALTEECNRCISNRGEYVREKLLKWFVESQLKSRPKYPWGDYNGRREVNRTDISDSFIKGFSQAHDMSFFTEKRREFIDGYICGIAFLALVGREIRENGSAIESLHTDWERINEDVERLFMDKSIKEAILRAISEAVELYQMPQNDTAPTPPPKPKKKTSIHEDPQYTGFSFGGIPGDTVEF